MRFLKTLIVCFLVFLTLSTEPVRAREYSLTDFNVNGISIPDSFFSCTRDECDNRFSALLSANGYTYSSWKEDVMLPGNLYICSRDASGDTINICVYDPSSEEDKESNIKYHRHMYDYNLYISSPKAKETVLIKYRDTLVDSGINKRKIHSIKWFEKDELSPFTPYIMGIYENNEAAFVCDFCTIYDGNTISVSLTSKNKPDAETISSMKEIIEGIDFVNIIDYSQAKQVYRQNQRVKLPEKLSVKQKKSKTLISLALTFISVVILSGIAITTAKIRKRTRSSRNSKNGRY